VRALAFIPLLALVAACGGAATTPPVAAPAAGAQPASGVGQRRGRGPSGAAAAAKPSSAPSAAEAEQALLERVEKMGRAPSPTGPSRPQVEPVEFRVADLPVTTAPPALTAAGMPIGESGPDLLIDIDRSGAVSPADYGARISLKEGSLGLLSVGPLRIARGSAATYVRCGAAQRWTPPSPVRWETFRGVPAAAVPGPGTSISDGRRPAPTIALEVAEGWLTAETCKVSVVRRSVIQARVMDPNGLVYGYRECGDSCAERETLTLIFPSARNIATSGVGGALEQEVGGGFSRVRIPLRRGGGGSVMAALAAFDLGAWDRAIRGVGATVPVAHRASSQFGPPVVLGVEVAQGIDDEEPIAVLYVDRSTALASGSDAIDIDDPLSARF
jgi:hypothetical protein